MFGGVFFNMMRLSLDAYLLVFPTFFSNHTIFDLYHIKL